jgi:hypothetical protein
LREVEGVDVAIESKATTAGSLLLNCVDDDTTEDNPVGV